MVPTAQVDHLVVVAATLAQGVQWCEATLGITPGPGGRHALMGTHNRLFKIASQRYPQAYFEIIAIDPAAPAPGRQRWFDMDDPILREQLARAGPQLVHFAASVPDARASVAALAAQDIDRGAIQQVSRPAAHGLLQWQITVRDDGQRLFKGCLPTLIQWGDTHPTQDMPDSGVTLQELQVSHPRLKALGAAYHTIGLHGVSIKEGPASLRAHLLTPRGVIEIHS
jgi:pimeloyl-ACP methyl ester carboxylesterase